MDKTELWQWNEELKAKVTKLETENADLKELLEKSEGERKNNFRAYKDSTEENTSLRAALRTIFATEPGDVGERLGRAMFVAGENARERSDGVVQWVGIPADQKKPFIEGALAVRRAVIAQATTDAAIEAAGNGYQDVLDGKTPGYPLRAAILAAFGAPVVDEAPRKMSIECNDATAGQLLAIAAAREDELRAQIEAVEAALEAAGRPALDAHKDRGQTKDVEISDAERIRRMSAELEAMRSIAHAAARVIGSYTCRNRADDVANEEWNVLRKAMQALSVSLAPDDDEQSSDDVETESERRIKSLENGMEELAVQLAQLKETVVENDISRSREIGRLEGVVAELEKKIGRLK